MQLFARALTFAGFMLVTLSAKPAQSQTKLLRFPDVHGDRLVFVYAGDLWLASIHGGTAQRLTTHPGVELFPKFSPDGSQIAFTAQYSGDEQVFVIPTSGGEPTQLTHYPARGPLPDRWGYDHQVYGWTPDGQSVLFRSMRHGWTNTDCRLYTVRATGGGAEQLPMPVSGAGDLSPDGKFVAYSPLFRDFRTWKRYQGGWAQELFLLHLETRQAEQITRHPRTDRDPMWVGGDVYFASDRDDKLNLYAYHPDSKQTEQITQYKDFDVRWPSAGGNLIVFEFNGELRVLNTEDRSVKNVNIFVPTELLAARRKHVNVEGRMEDFHVSPGGERVLITARGDLFTVPAEHGATRNLTHTSNARDQAAAWSPDGKHIAYLSDATGEEELFLIPQDGSAAPAQLTSGGAAKRYAPRWSPDGSRIAFADKDGKLYSLEVATRQVQIIANEARGQVRDYTWSPCSQWLAFSLSDVNLFRSLYLWKVGDSAPKRITDELWNERAPVWDPAGKYLYYLSDRDFVPQMSHNEFNVALNRETGIFALALRADVPHPFPPRSDEVTDPASESPKPEPSSPKPDAAGAVAAKTSDQPVSAPTTTPAANESGTSSDQPRPATVIEWEGLAARVIRVPLPGDNYSALTATEGTLFYIRSSAHYYGRSPESKPELRAFDLKERKESTVLSDVLEYRLAARGKKILAQQAGKLVLLEAKPDGGSTAKPVATSELYADVDPRQEWKQMFNEVWRNYRDFFYVENLHGHDWQALKERFEQLLEHVAHRSDLNYVIGEMISELNVGHAYIAGGDREIPARPDVALPGALFRLDPASQRYRLETIFTGHNEEDLYRAPLTEVGVNVRAGEYVLAIEGEPLLAKDDPYRLLQFKSAHPVTLLVNQTPTLEGARKVKFNPIRDESNLAYFQWVANNRAKVEAATGGRIGYLHIPDMGEDGIREFSKWFYGQIRKEGMIVDVRTNGGGNVSQIILERFRRTLLATGFARTDDTPTTYPDQVFHGSLVCLIDEDSASDGDIFPAMFRQAGLGPLIGKRSWGGVIGITGGELMDGGSLAVPEYGFNAVDGAWIIEGHGVDPDIEVDNHPSSVIAGQDPQLERGIEEVLKRVNAQPKRLPIRPAPPVKP